MSIGPGAGNPTPQPKNVPSYNTGTFLPSLTGFAVTGALTALGSFTQIGRLVFVRISLAAATSIVCTAGTSFINNLPIVAAQDAPCVVANDTTFASEGVGVVQGIKLFPPSFSSGAGEVVVISTCFEM